ncbi:MAG: Gfo/Idh/MocA family oxidoreductase [Pseudomonadota bacterium]
MRTAPVRVGLVGCGDIARTYLRLAPSFGDIEIVACADLNPEAARARAAEHGLTALSVESLLAQGDIDVVANLTPPRAHFAVAHAAVSAGKHVYCEKPVVSSLQEATALAQAADAHGVRVGAAPDTFLGGAHQRARQLVDNGILGRITSGTAHMMGRGMEHWHPNPAFFFQAGAGPVLDMGPYYVTQLVHLLGPVEQVVALGNRGRSQRTVLSEPRAGEVIPVETPTTVHAVLGFASGAVVTLGTSWDVQHHSHLPMELYGEHGSLTLPDPNFFGGAIVLCTDRHPTGQRLAIEHPLAVENEADAADQPRANYRGVGLADMASAIRQNRPHRCTLALATHVLEVLLAIQTATENGDTVHVSTSCGRPIALSANAATELLRPR